MVGPCLKTRVGETAGAVTRAALRGLKRKLPSQIADTTVSNSTSSEAVDVAMPDCLICFGSTWTVRSGSRVVALMNGKLLASRSLPRVREVEEPNAEPAEIVSETFGPEPRPAGLHRTWTEPAVRAGSS